MCGTRLTLRGTSGGTRNTLFNKLNNIVCALTTLAVVVTTAVIIARVFGSLYIFGSKNILQILDKMATSYLKSLKYFLCFGRSNLSVGCIMI